MRVAVIGSGPGGQAVAFSAARQGMQVSLIEKAAIGGVCLNQGCIASKSLRASAIALNMARHLPEYGIMGCNELSLDCGKVQERKNTIIRNLASGLQRTCAQQDIDYIQGHASIVAPGKIKINSAGNEHLLACEAIIIAAGSDIAELPGLAFDHKYILNSNDALALDHIPKRILLLGGGVIGCELACIFAAFGSEVTIVEAQDRLLPLPAIDTDTSTFLAREMRKRKIKFYTGATVKTAEIVADCLMAKISPTGSNDESKQQEITADVLIVTVGRKPALAGLGLEQVGVKLSKRGWIEADANFRTNIPGIYAIGDVLGPERIMLAHVASMEGLAVIRGLAGGDGSMDYRAVPSAIFTSPEIASVGLTEAQARAEYEQVKCGLTQMRELGMAHVLGELSGFFKIVANGADGRILGIHLAGAHASEILAECTLAVSQGLKVQDLASVIHAHPTISEGIFNTACSML